MNLFGKKNYISLEKPETRPWGARNMSFYDPDGNVVYIRSLPPEAT